VKAESADVALDVPAFAGALMAARFRQSRRGEDVVKLIGQLDCSERVAAATRTFGLRGQETIGAEQVSVGRNLRIGFPILQRPLALRALNAMKILSATLRSIKHRCVYRVWLDARNQPLEQCCLLRLSFAVMYCTRPFELSVLVDPSQHKGSEVGELVTDRIEVNSYFLCEKHQSMGKAVLMGNYVDRLLNLTLYRLTHGHRPLHFAG